MACITVSVDENFKKRLDRFPWVNWSEIGREELLKRYIFDTYIKTGKLTKNEEKFCEQIDWHPVDELPIKEEYIRKLNRNRKSSRSKPMEPKDLKKWFAEL
jgi:hypothetical protein